MTSIKGETAFCFRRKSRDILRKGAARLPVALNLGLGLAARPVPLRVGLARDMELPKLLSVAFDI
jgi:hypothetical protein